VIPYDIGCRKFGVDAMFRTGICPIIQSSYLTGGANSTRTGDSRWGVCQHVVKITAEVIALVKTRTVACVLVELNDEDEEHCGRGYVKCASADECIQQSWLCDGDLDCSDHSDELHCQLET